MKNLSTAHSGKHKQTGKGSPDRVLPVPATWIRVTSSRQLQPPPPSSTRSLIPETSDLVRTKALLYLDGEGGAEEELGRKKPRQRPLRPAPASECVLGKPWAGAEQVFHGSGIRLTADDPGT